MLNTEDYILNWVGRKDKPIVTYAGLRLMKIFPTLFN